MPIFEPAFTVPTRYWSRLDDGRIQCNVCPRYCRLQEGQRGFCFVRARENDAIVLTTYGRSSGFCVDPVEKKPLNHFLPGSSVLSFGTAGCNLGCLFCQNWDISKSRETDTLASAATPEKIANIAKEYGCESIAFTYNDPTIFIEYAIDVAKACHDLGIRTIAVTAGYICPEPREEFYGYMDAANVDLKAFSENFYSKICSGHLDSVLDTLVYLKTKTNVWLEITTLLIPGENDSPEELDAMTRWIAEHLGPDVPLHFSAFHPDFKMLDRTPTPLTTVRQAREIALRNGLHYVYTGNVRDPEGGITHCANCKRAVISRDYYAVTDWHLDADGKCEYCGSACAGVFHAAPGTWGNRRQPVRQI